MKIEQLHRLFLTCSAACTDTRKIKKNTMFFALKGENFDGNAYAEKALESGAKYTIIDNPKYDILNETILVENVLETLQHLAAFHRMYLKIPIIALTGSNGKTTTKELINATLSQKYRTTATIGNLNNHIGVPLTLLSMTEDAEIGIVEMGANHLEEIKFLCKIARPDYGYITNFGKAHLEGFGSVKGVIKGKSELYDFLIRRNKTIFINGNDSIQVEKTKNSNVFSFGTTSKSHVQIEFVEAQPNVKVKYKSLSIQSHLIGEYNYTNIAVAIAIAHYFEVDAVAIKTAIEDYTSNNNRSQVLKKESNTVVLDAYNANPTSMHAALLNFNNLKSTVKTAILGDMFELGEEAEKEHQSVVDLIRVLNFDTTFLIGKNFYKTEANSKNIIQYESFDDFKKDFSFSKIENTSILIKGSRGMALERVLDL
ncbi:UDP-N-acetylmuramoyl-tripeptide--D-alanyl-D-alanine ligase [Mariniflexile ostreae]|uniref:UDP-N-acetylmuramoyl-tripeptide--D-alanyl-D-alanine ligase n=1 Tax=Mariniflexile ostreae TaxID=1520892 RepID=A0ABV5FCW6_9FLAO